MKKIGTALLILGVGVCTVACAAPPTESDRQASYRPNHEAEGSLKGDEVSLEASKQISASLLEQIQSEQPSFNEEGHGYFRVQGDSMTPNFYEGDIVRVTGTYQDGDFVALTIEATGEHLLKQLVNGELVSSNASGGYYQLEDVTIHGKVEKVQRADVEVTQVLQAATGVYVVDTASTKHYDHNSNVYVLLSNGQVYARFVYGDVSRPAGSFNGGWSNPETEVNAKWYLSGTSFPLPSGVTPVSISVSDTYNHNSNLYVLLSNGQVYARYVYGDVNKAPGSFNGGWTNPETETTAKWNLSGTTIPQSLVNAPNGGTLNVPENRLVGRTSAGSGDAEYLTQAQTKQLLQSTDFLYYPIGTTAASVGMVEVTYHDATTRIWKSSKMGIDIYHTVTLYALPTSAGDLTIR